MRLKSKKLFWRLSTFANDGTGNFAGGDGGGGASAAGGESAASGAEGGSPDVKNNSENNQNPFAGMWDNSSAGDNDPAAAPANPNGNIPPPAAPTAPQSADEIFNNHFSELQIGQSIDQHELLTKIQAGDTEALPTAMNTMAKDLYKAVVLQNSKMMDARIEKAVEQAVSQSSGEFQSDLAQRELFEALPFAKDDAIKPVAVGVFTQFVKKGSSVAEAITKTGDYFKHTFQMASKQLGIQSPPAGQPGQNGFNPANSIGQNDEDEPDWVGIMTGQSSS